MAKLTRLASTVTARYYPASDLTDAFYLDGRLSGKREARAADITVDKEDRGFFFSVFSHSTAPGRDPAAEQAFEAPLRKLYNEIKTGRKALDDEIGDLVNTAVAVTGRMKLQADNARTPFFAGILVKDSEAFAITMGKGLAFLYRDDTLFPLTATDLQIEPVNTQRQKVENFYNYCATKTATALCSNIAQLKMDDCIIICNREIYEALGQQELLRILYDAEDQCDAAGTVITEAAAKLPGVPLQFMISFVESVSAQEKSGLFGFGKKNRQQSYNEVDDEAIEIPIAKAAPYAAAVPAAPIPAAAAAPAAPVSAEPLYFGNDASNPFVQPLAEQPVTPPGPEDPMHFQDEPLEPFGEPVAEDEPETDEGGFVKPEFEDEDADFKSADFHSADKSDSIPYQPDSFGIGAQNAPQYISDISDEEEEGEPLVFGDDSSPAQQNEESSAGGTFYIPFESKEPAAPSKTNINDIPDMPLYEAPTYSPPTYPTNSYTPKGYDNAGVYARGSYSFDDEDSDMRRDLPPNPAPSNRSYSYTPPQQTVPSYATIKDQRSAQQGGQYRPGQQQATQQTPRPRMNQRSSQDMFDQEKSFDYGDTDTAYKRNKLLVAILVAVSVICVIILIVALVSGNNKSKTPASTTTVASVTLSVTPSDSAAAVTPGAVTTVPGSTDAAATTAAAPAVAPVAVFYFSDQTGFRTWWDVFYYAYQIKLDSNTDPRISTIITYNQKSADYVPQPGDKINLPPLSMLTGTATTAPAA